MFSQNFDFLFLISDFSMRMVGGRAASRWSNFTRLESSPCRGCCATTRTPSIPYRYMLLCFQTTRYFDRFQLHFCKRVLFKVNPRVPCNSGVIPRIDFTKWIDSHPSSAFRTGNGQNFFPRFVQKIWWEERAAISSHFNFTKYSMSIKDDVSSA